MPACPICGASSKLAGWHVRPATQEQFERGVDNYSCPNKHLFEAAVPIKLENGRAVRADI